MPYIHKGQYRWRPAPASIPARLPSSGPASTAPRTPPTTLATLADRIWQSWAESKRIAEREVLGEGGIYSAHEGRFIPLLARDEPPVRAGEMASRKIILQFCKSWGLS